MPNLVKLKTIKINGGINGKSKNMKSNNGRSVANQFEIELMMQLIFKATILS